MNIFHIIQAGLASFLPGWKTIGLAGGLATFNLLDWIQMNYQTFGGFYELIPEPYKTIMNVVIPALIMYFRNIQQRADIAKIEAAKLPA